MLPALSAPIEPRIGPERVVAHPFAPPAPPHPQHAHPNVSPQRKRPRPRPVSRAPVVPVTYASDMKRDLSATPATLIGAVTGVGDRSAILSMA